MFCKFFFIIILFLFSLNNMYLGKEKNQTYTVSSYFPIFLKNNIFFVFNTVSYYQLRAMYSVYYTFLYLFHDLF